MRLVETRKAEELAFPKQKNTKSGSGKSLSLQQRKCTCIRLHFPSPFLTPTLTHRWGCSGFLLPIIRWWLHQGKCKQGGAGRRTSCLDTTAFCLQIARKTKNFVSSFTIDESTLSAYWWLGAIAVPMMSELAKLFRFILVYLEFGNIAVVGYSIITQHLIICYFLTHLITLC